MSLSYKLYKILFVRLISYNYCSVTVFSSLRSFLKLNKLSNTVTLVSLCIHLFPLFHASLRWVLQAVSSASWPVCLWSFFRAGRSSSGRGGLLPSCWPSQSSSSPLVCFLGLTTLPTSVVLYQDSSSPSPSCRTSGRWRKIMLAVPACAEMSSQWLYPCSLTETGAIQKWQFKIHEL